MAKGAETRGNILEQALSLATQVGLEGVTIGKLAEHVGMSKSGLFAHFSSKDNLGVAILDEARDRFVRLVVAPALREKRGEPRVRALIERWAAWAKADFMPGGCIFVTASVELDDKPGPARDRLVESQRDWLSTLSQAVRIAVEEGHFRPDLDPEQVAYALLTSAYGYHIISRLLGGAQHEKRFRAELERILRDARGNRS
jgi:AcrR family transcriptional regulator